MNGMSVDVPEMEELLRPVPVARYGDDADGAARGGALHLSSLLSALACAIGHPTPTAVHCDPTRRTGSWACRRSNPRLWC